MKNTLACLFLFTGLNLFAQVPEPINSGELILKASNLYGEKEYDRALKYLRKIDRNDTNYVLALSALSEILLAAEKNDSAIIVCKEGIEINKDNDISTFYINLAVSHMRKKEFDQALEILNTALKRYPKHYLLYYNIASCYRGLENMEKALEYYKKTVLTNPYYSQAHLSLGLMAAEEGQVSQAMMALNMFIILEPNSSSGNYGLSKLNEIVASKYEREPKNVALSPAGGDDFSDQNLLITNYVALDKKYKVPVKSTLPLIKQNHLLLSKMDYDKDDKGFWTQTYVPFFKELYKKGLFEGFIYHILQSSGNSEHQKLVSKNIDAKNQFARWANVKVGEIQYIREVELNGKKTEAMHIFSRDDHDLEVIGSYNKETEKLEGYAEIYYEDGNIYATGMLDKEGKRTGNWTYFHQNGEISEKLTLKDGEFNGPYEVFYNTGIKKREGVYSKGIQNGIMYEYNKAGKLTEINPIKEDKLDGEFKIFYDLGKEFLHYTGEYKAGKITDTLFEYYDDGQLASFKIFTDGEANGDYRSYYRNGQLASEYKLEFGLKEGPYKSYFSDGKLSEEGQYHEGVSVGNWKSYYQDGKLEEEAINDEKGKKNGILKKYDTDGKLHYEMEYIKGEVISYKYYAKDGSILKEDKRRRGEFELIGYYPDGVKKMEGIFSREGKNGLWKYYDHNGVLSAEETYNKDGELEGKYISYYVDGTVKEETLFKNDQRNGYSTTYFPNKTKKSEGYYEEGKAQGYWYYYYPNGKLESKDYYVKGKLKGYQEEYNITGNSYQTKYYEDGLLTKVVYYDTTGKEFETIEMKSGTGDYVMHFPNKKVRFKGQYTLAIAHGEFLWKYPDGTVNTKGEYYNDERHGLWVWTNEDGKKTSETNYSFGNREGKATTYYTSNGKPEEVNNFHFDKLEGESVWYYENGQVELTKSYVNGDAEGPAYYYGPDGELQMVRYYEKGKAVAYSYHDSEGKLKPRIPINSLDYTVVTYYKNGNKAREYEVKNGQFHGTYNEYYSSGQLKEVTHYENDQATGKNIEYYEDGKVKDEKIYLMGYLNGIHKQWHKNGKLQSEFPYSYGELHGACKFYDINGKLKKTKVYYSDSLIELKRY